MLCFYTQAPTLPYYASENACYARDYAYYVNLVIFRFKISLFPFHTSANSASQLK